MNKYSDTEANKVDDSDTSSAGNVVKPDNSGNGENDGTESSDNSSNIGNTHSITPVDKQSFNFKVLWEDNTAEDKHGKGSNLANNSLLFTYSNTKAAENLYVTVSNVDTHEIVKSSLSEYVGRLIDGRSVYKISYLNGASQVEFKSALDSSASSKAVSKSGKVLNFEYKVYQYIPNGQTVNLQTLIDNSTELYSGHVVYTYDKLKQAGYTVTDKLNSVVNSNIGGTDDLRNLQVARHNMVTREVIYKLPIVSIATGLNNAAYSVNYKYGKIAYEYSTDYETPNHEKESLIMKGIPEGLTPVVNHQKLSDGSYKIDMRDLLRENNGSTTINFKPEYTLERLNSDGTQFIQVVKDSYGFTLYSASSPVGKDFRHNTINITDSFRSIDKKKTYGEFVSLVDEKHSHLPMFAEYSHLGDGLGKATVVYDLHRVESHFNKVSNTDSTVYAYVNGSWIEVSRGGELHDVVLPANTKKVALSHNDLIKGKEKSPVFDVSLDDATKFSSENKDTRRYLDLHARVFLSSDVVTYMNDDDILKEDYLLTDRVWLLSNEEWNHNIGIEYSKYSLPARSETTAINVRTSWKTNGPSDPLLEHPTTHVDYYVHLNKDVAKLSPRFNDRVQVLSKTKVDDGVVYRIAFKDSKTVDFTMYVDSDGITPVNGRVTVGKIDNYPGKEASHAISEAGSTLSIGGTDIDFGSELKGKYVTETSSTVEFKALREIFSKLELETKENSINSETKEIVYNYALVGKVNDNTGKGKAIKSAIFGIPKTLKGTILDLAKVLENTDGVSYSYELGDSGVFIDSIQSSDLQKVTKVKVTYADPFTVDPETPWFLSLPLVLNEDSKATKDAVGTLTFEYSDNTSLVTNTVKVNKEFKLLERADVLKFSFLNVFISQDTENNMNPLYRPHRITSLRKYLQDKHTEVVPGGDVDGINIRDSLNGEIDRSYLVDRIYTGTTGEVTLNTDDLFEYLYYGRTYHVGNAPATEDLVSTKGKIEEVLPYLNDPNYEIDNTDGRLFENNTHYELQAITKIDKAGHESFLRKGEKLNVSEIREIRAYYTPYTKIKARGYIYAPRVDDPDEDVRSNPVSKDGTPVEDFLNTMLTLTISENLCIMTT